MAALPEEFTTNAELQEKVHTRFTAFMEVLEKDFTDAGVVDLCSTQLDCVVVGSMVHQYYLRKKFGEGLKEWRARGQRETGWIWLEGVMRLCGVTTIGVR